MVWDSRATSAVPIRVSMHHFAEVASCLHVVTSDNQSKPMTEAPMGSAAVAVGTFMGAGPGSCDSTRAG